MIDAGVAGAIGAGLPLIVWEIARAIGRKVGRASTLPQRMDRLESITVMIAKEVSIQTDAHKATLEALKGQCNGNVDSALAKIEGIRVERDEFYRRQAIRAPKE